MSVCNGITDGTKMCGSECVGNCFILHCLFHTQLSQKLIATYPTVLLNSYKECLKLYLSCDWWLNNSHSWREVQNSTKPLGKLITLIKLCFPRTDGNGWKIPKNACISQDAQKYAQLWECKQFLWTNMSTSVERHCQRSCPTNAMTTGFVCSTMCATGI